MRLTDIEKLFATPEATKQGTREVKLETKELVEQLKKDSSLAMEKIKAIPQATKDELKPFFAPTFFKEGTA